MTSQKSSKRGRLSYLLPENHTPMKKSGSTLQIKRYDLSKNRSLRAHNAADEYMLEFFNSLHAKPQHPAIYFDRFGFLTCHLHSSNPTVVLTQKSQEKSIRSNLEANRLVEPSFTDPLAPLEKKIDLALIQVPKSLALLELFLSHLVQNSTKEVTVVLGFMTRHFTTNLLETCKQYFESVEQSKAVKKARLITLTGKKEFESSNPIDVVEFNKHVYKQYWGVFSAKHIDYATQFLLEHLDLKDSDQRILDLGSGNGVISREILKEVPTADLSLLDDSFLAYKSGQLNLVGENIHHHFDNDLSNFEDEYFDLIVSNPPFHFEYEINIETPIQLFNESIRCLKVNGRLQIVANKHLNYMTHLKPIFKTVEVVNENEKYIIYKCVK